MHFASVEKSELVEVIYALQQGSRPPEGADDEDDVKDLHDLS